MEKYSPQLPLKRGTLISLLKNLHLRIVFVKQDAETRELYCTLRKEDLPPVDETKTSTKKPNKEIIAVWDLEKEAWRSFRLDSVVEIEIMFQKLK